jgi:hypothetical protein
MQDFTNIGELVAPNMALDYCFEYKIRKFLISKKIGCSEGRFRSRDEKKQAEKM